MVPATLPPPTPLKLFEFAAGVFEMKPGPFVLAIFCGKLTQFIVCSLLTIWFGPKLVHSMRHVMHRHLGLVIGIAIAALLALIFFVVRRTFDRRKGIELPMEDGV
jgi:membrane protein DedA with SNARE-associated domain